MSDRGRLSLCLWMAAVLWTERSVAAEGQAETAAPVSAGRKLSERTSSLIRAELPRYVPSMDLAEPPSGEAVGEMKGDVFHLPSMTVREVRKAPPTSTDWFTAQGRLDFAMKRFPGTRIGNFWGSNNYWAEARLTEDLEAGRHAALKERGRDVLLGDTPEERETRELLKAALMYSGRPASK